jgi:hypothetical protein
MKEIKEHVDTNSADYKREAEAGLDSTRDTKELPPLFISGESENKKGDLQDEKDESEE